MINIFFSIVKYVKILRDSMGFFSAPWMTLIKAFQHLISAGLWTICVSTSAGIVYRY